MLSTLSISFANRPINVDLYTKKFAVCKKTMIENSHDWMKCQAPLHRVEFTDVYADTTPSLDGPLS